MVLSLRSRARRGPLPVISYDAIVWFPLLLLLGGVAAGLIIAGRPLAGAVLAALLALGFLSKVQYGFDAYGGAKVLRSWAEHHEHAFKIHQRAQASLQILPFAAPPALLAFIGAAIAAARRRTRWLLGLGLVAWVPTLVFLVWIGGDAFALPPEDPSWVLGYLHEWRAAGRPPENGGPCHVYLMRQEELHARLDAAVTQEADLDCRALCRSQAESGGYNPGAIERFCAALIGPKATPSP